jgi:hypothetical protein
MIWEISLVEFIFITGILGGGTAWITGRATALTWSPRLTLVVYIALLTLALRFIHFSLFSGTFLLPFSTLSTGFYYYVVDFIVLTALATLGRRMTRAAQMATQYGFLYDRTGLFGWRQKPRNV